MLNFLLTIIVAYAIVLLVIRIFESHFIFFPNYPGRLEGDWHPADLPVADVQITTADQLTLRSWWIPNADPATKFTFLAFHGNASNIANRTDIYRFLHETPANVLAVEYRGYGRSSGSPSESGIYRDADAAYQYLVDTQDIPPEGIIAFGQSLGTAVATDLASRRKVAALVLEAPFPSASAVARRSFAFLPGISLLVRGQLDTASKIQRINAPLLIVHCSDDPVIPFAMGEKVFAAAREPKFFLRIESSCHEEASLMSPARYRAALTQFLANLNP